MNTPHEVTTMPVCDDEPARRRQNASRARSDIVGTELPAWAEPTTPVRTRPLKTT